MRKRIAAAMLALCLLCTGAFADFTDVPNDAWYAEAVDYVIDNGIMGSTVADAKVFAPNGTVTRATVFQTLYNMEGKPAVSDTAAEGSALVTGEDGLYPVLMAAAATKSLHEGRPVKISEIE